MCRALSDCVHEQVAKADCECPLYKEIEGYMKKKKNRIIASLCIIVLVVCCIVKVIPQNKVEPYNPLLSQVDPLKIDQNLQFGGATGQKEEQIPEGEKQDSGQKETKQEDLAEEHQEKQQKDVEQKEEPSTSDSDGIQQTETDSNMPSSVGNQGQNNSTNPETDNSGNLPASLSCR